MDEWGSMRRLSWLAFSVSCAASFGVVMAAAGAVVEVREQAYWTLGLPGNAVRVLLSATTDAAITGAIAGAILFVLVTITRSAWRAAVRDRGPEWLPYIVCLCLAMLTIGAQTLAQGSIGAHRVWAVVAAAGIWCGVLHSRSRSFVERSPLLSMLVRTHLYIIPVLTIVVVLVPNAEEWVRWDRNVIVSGLAVYGVLLFLFHRLSPGDSVDTVRIPWLLAAPVVLPLLVAVASRFFVEPGVELRRPANVVLIAIDTLRLDRTSLLDHTERNTTPHLADLARRGTHFEHAISQAPWTMPAFASVMTGRYPREHGDFRIYRAA